MSPKTPPGKMSEHELVQWIFENDFDYWAKIYIESGGDDPARIEELFREEVYDIIDDEVLYGSEYKEFLLDEEDEDDY